MKTQSKLADTSNLPRSRKSQSLLHRRSHGPWFATLPALTLLILTAITGLAGSATWNLNPGNNQWELNSNWTPADYPDGPNDIATFGVSNITDPTMAFHFEDEINSIVFNTDASPYTITVESFTSFDFVLTVSGQGIINNSGIAQHFVAEEDVCCQTQGMIQFTNSATAGDLTVFTANTFAQIAFFDSSTAANATLIANADLAVIKLADDSDGGTARVEVFDKLEGFSRGTLDISAHNAPGVTVGSIEGNGIVVLGTNNLTVGSNNLSTNFDGVIRGAGSLIKIGTGKLTLSGSNKYSGGTIVNDGALLINNKRGSATGKRPVQVNAGILGGTGTIGGSLTVGTGSGSGAFLSPGVAADSHRTLTIRSTLIFGSDSTYRCGFNSGTARPDSIVANGVTINTGAQFFFEDSNGSTLPFGTILTVIDNTSATPIAGTFFNLSDGSTFTVGSNTFQANYEGGDGNDLTLTAIP